MTEVVMTVKVSLERYQTETSSEELETGLKGILGMRLQWTLVELVVHLRTLWSAELKDDELGYLVKEVSKQLLCIEHSEMWEETDDLNTEFVIKRKTEWTSVEHS